MNTQQFTNTRQFNWQFTNHCYGAAAIAAKRIAEGETIYFDVFIRPNKNDSTEMKFKQRFYFGIVNIGDKPALRVSHSKDLMDHSTHSLIPSWNEQAIDSATIAARLTLFLAREGADWFIQEN